VSGPWDRPLQRAVRLAGGLVLFGLSLALLLKAGLGLDPWNVFHQGVALNTGMTIGQATLVTSVVVLFLAWLVLRVTPGLGTIANALIVGPVLDLGVAWIPEAPDRPSQAAFLVAAIVGTAIASGLYIGAGWGPGSRDGLMTGLAARGVPVFAARAGIEITVLVVGWALGGSVGLATALFALAIGPLVHHALLRLALAPARSAARQPPPRPTL
jgi:uncharacterized membrane protein YczE